MFSEPTENASTQEIWQCVVEHSIGHIRNNEGTKTAWRELRGDKRLNELKEDLGECIYSDAEIQLNKAILAGFLK